MNPPRLVLVLAVVLTGLSAGFFFTYEASVTLGLAQVDDRTYVETFQAINDTIRNAAFGVVFFGAIPAIGAALLLHRDADSGTRALLGAGLALYLVCVGVTVAGNVPLNDELAETIDVTDANAAAARADFEDDWNRLNLIRTIAVITGFVSVTAALSRPSSTPPTPQPDAIVGPR